MSLVSRTEDFTSNNTEYTKDESNDMNDNKFRHSKRKKLEDFGIEYKNQDLIEALEVLYTSTHIEVPQKETKEENNQIDQGNIETEQENKESKQRIENIQLKISKRLVEALTKENFLINQEKIEILYKKIEAIKSSEKDSTAQREEIQSTLQQLSSEEMLGLFFYAYVYSFRKTQIIDKNDIENLRIPKLYKLMPEKPKDLPPKPKREDFHSKYEYLKSVYKWDKDKIKYRIAYKKRANRSPERKRKEDAQKYLKKYLTELFYKKSQNTYSSKVKAAAATPILSEGMPNFLEHQYYPDILPMSQEEETALENMVKSLKEGKNFIIMVNHDTFANIPAVIIKIMQTARKLGIEDINEFIHTAIGDLIMCNIQQEALMNTVSNICPTSPATNKIPGGNPIARQRRKNFTNYLEKILLSGNTSKNKGWGHLVIMAPSGTRDVIHRTKSGKTYIFIPDETQPSNKLTLGFVRGLAKQGVPTIAISTNTSDIKRPNPAKGVTANNHEMNPGAKVTMHFNKLYKDNQNDQFDITEMSNGEVIDVLASGITCINQEPCGIKVPIEIFSYIKGLTKSPEYSDTGHLPERLFIDEDKGELNFKLIKEEQQLQNKAA